MSQIENEKKEVKYIQMDAPSVLAPMKAAERIETLEEVRKAFSSIAGASAALVSLDEATRQATFRPMQGVEAPALNLAAVVEENAALAAQMPKTVDPREMRDQIELLMAITRLRADVARWSRWLDDTALVLRSELYQSAAVIYRITTADPRANTDVVEKVKVFSDFVSRGKTGPKPEDDPVVLEPTPDEPIVPFSNGHANGSDTQ